LARRIVESTPTADPLDLSIISIGRVGDERRAPGALRVPPRKPPALPLPRVPRIAVL